MKILYFLTFWIFSKRVAAFQVRYFSIKNFLIYGGNGHNPPPKTPKKYLSDGFSHEDDFKVLLSIMGSFQNQDKDNLRDKEEDADFSSSTLIHVRGGGTTSKSDPFNRILKGAATTMKTSLMYWSGVFKSAKEMSFLPLRSLQSSLQKLSPSLRRNTEQDEEEAKIIHDLQTIIVRDVSAPNATTLPKDVLINAARRSGLLGGTLRPDSVQECAKLIKQWYLKQGFVLNAMTGATLIPEESVAVLSIQEPLISNIPVGITFAKELVVDPETNQPMTYREYRQYHHRRKTNKHNILSKENMNTTLVETDGRTRPIVLAKAMRLHPGENFCWNQQRWDRIRSSGIFSRVLRASPEKMRDGSVQLHIIAQEAPPRNLEYGVSRSLYTGSWEGELDFLHGNILGGGETLGLVVRRGAKDPEPSVRLRFQDDKFGLEGGYNVELFNDYVAVDGLSSTDSASNLMDPNAVIDHASADSSGTGTIDKIIDPTFDDGALISRKGLTVRLRDPNFVPVLQRSSFSTSVERTSTRTGKHEEIGSFTLDLGPVQRILPFQARANLLTSYTIGTRLYESGINTWHRNFLPYSSAAVTSRQIIPISYGEDNEERRPIELAFQHSVMTSSCNLPRHEANAAGIAARVRGYPLHSNGPINKYIAGTTELRVPIPLPLEKVIQDANVILFGDWMYGERISAATSAKPSIRRASIGIGLRKSVQGLPLKYDICVTDDRKIGGFFSLGLDFDV